MAFNRRTFLVGCSVAACLPLKAAPSERIHVGMIGLGRQAMGANLKPFLNSPDTQVVAVCDADKWRMENARKAVDEAYARMSPSGSYKGCRAYGNFRELLADRSINAVMISTPDHWHVPMGLAAVEAGKDVALEKPITRYIAEGRALSDAVTRHKRVFRTDSEFRSLPTFHRAVELVRNGRIGQLQKIHTEVPQDDLICPPQPDMPVPPELDYESWQGPAVHAPYTQKRVHTPHSYDRGGWMRLLNYCDGMIVNWGTHLNDIAQWGNNTDRTGPVEVEGHGTYPPAGNFWNNIITYEFSCRYANGVRLTSKTGTPSVRFEGTEGWIYAEYGTGFKLEAKPASILNSKIGPEGVHFPLMSEKQDFINAVKTRGHTLEDAEVGHRTTSLCHLGHIAIQIGGVLHWDPDKERFTNSDAANALVIKPILKPRHA